MQNKSLIWLGLFAGSTLGGLVPTLWGANMFSFSSMFFSSIGAIAGIYLVFKISK